MVMMGGNIAVVFHSDGFLSMKVLDSRAMAVRAVSVYESPLTINEYRGGGKLALRYGRRGLTICEIYSSMAEDPEQGLRLLNSVVILGIFGKARL